MKLNTFTKIYDFMTSTKTDAELIVTDRELRLFLEMQRSNIHMGSLQVH